MITRAGLVALALALFLPAPAAAEVIVGVNGGVVIPGAQDLSFRNYSADHAVTDKVDTDDVKESAGALVGASVAWWGDWSFLRYFGLQGEAVYWYMEAKPATIIPPAPRYRIDQHRTAALASLLARVPVYPTIGRFSPDQRADTFVYAGGGAGVVYSTVSHGSDDWGMGYQLLGGISVPMTPNLRLRLESRWMLTGDVDTSPKDKLVGWHADVSGTPTSVRRNEAFDTRFFPIILGVDWRF
jgi:opacity protein-like surface antigen